MTVRSLADLLPACAHVLDVPGSQERGGWLAESLPPGMRHVVVLLVDGLGARQLVEHAEHAPRLAALAELGPLAAPFPSSTAISLTTLGTGLTPGLHGIVSTAFRLPEDGVLNPLRWAADVNPIATQPEPTVLERMAAAGVLVVSAGPRAYTESGLTRAALRGGEQVGADTVGERAHAVRTTIERARAQRRASFTYVYWPDLDKAGHIAGPGSAAYLAELPVVDRLVARLADLMAPDAALLVTADHGMVGVPDDRRVDIEALPGLRDGVQAIHGEPRVRHVYTEPGRAEEVAATWRARLSGDFEVLTRDEVLPLYGPTDEWHEERIGDVVVIAQEDWALVSATVDSLVSSLRGQHGALTDAEVLVPLRLAVG